jgi:hypothetical protein
VKIFFTRSLASDERLDLTEVQPEDAGRVLLAEVYEEDIWTSICGA